MNLEGFFDTEEGRENYALSQELMRHFTEFHTLDHQAHIINWIHKVPLGLWGYIEKWDALRAVLPGGLVFMFYDNEILIKSQTSNVNLVLDRSALFDVLTEIKREARPVEAPRRA